MTQELILELVCPSCKAHHHATPAAIERQPQQCPLCGDPMIHVHAEQPEPAGEYHKFPLPLVDHLIHFHGEMDYTQFDRLVYMLYKAKDTDGIRSVIFSGLDPTLFAVQDDIEEYWNEAHSFGYSDLAELYTLTDREKFVLNQISIAEEYIDHVEGRH